ncbi:MAG: hypothetical protein R3C11_25250 [Planctomycetaceae bacterium]
MSHSIRWTVAGAITILFAGTLFLVNGTSLFAESEIPTEVIVEQPARLELEPAQINLVGARSVQQLVTTGFYSNDETGI